MLKVNQIKCCDACGNFPVGSYCQSTIREKYQYDSSSILGAPSIVSLSLLSFSSFAFALWIGHTGLKLSFLNFVALTRSFPLCRVASRCFISYSNMYKDTLSTLSLSVPSYSSKLNFFFSFFNFFNLHS